MGSKVCSKALDGLLLWLVMGNWFHGDTRGFIMTVWNSHTSVGNMVGKALSSFALSGDGGDVILVITGQRHFLHVAL